MNNINFPIIIFLLGSLISVTMMYVYPNTHIRKYRFRTSYFWYYFNF